MNYDFDLFVIGGGSGGVRAARLAAEKGKKTALAEGDKMGGTCVIRGCVPKKLMLYASDFSENFEHAKGFGWELPTNRFEWPKFHQKLRAELERLENVYEGIMERNGVRVFKDWAELDGPNHIKLHSGMRFSAERILIATGGHPSIPDFEGKEHAITSDDIFHLENLPSSILIKGGGYIASEFAGILNQLGCKVTQIYRGDLILRGYDQEIREITSKEMQRRGIDLRYQLNLQKLERTQNGKKRATFDNGDVEEFDEVLVATGRAPNTKDLGLENAGIKLNGRAIAVDAYSQTNIPNIHAIGDVTGRAALTPVAIREAVNFIETVYKNNPGHINYDLIPTAIFTRPEIGMIGLSEEKAREAGYDVSVFSTQFRPMLAAFAENDDIMMMKIIVDRPTDKVLGVHILGAGAGEMIQLVAIAVTMGATKTQFDATIAVHPTAAEELVTLKTSR